MDSTAVTILVAVITACGAAGIGALAARRVNRADAADKLVNGAVRLVEQHESDNDALKLQMLMLRQEMEGELASAREELAACERRHDRMIRALSEQGIDLGDI